MREYVFIFIITFVRLSSNGSKRWWLRPRRCTYPIIVIINIIVIVIVVVDEDEEEVEPIIGVLLSWYTRNPSVPVESVIELASNERFL